MKMRSQRSVSALLVLVLCLSLVLSGYSGGTEESKAGSVAFDQETSFSIDYEDPNPPEESVNYADSILDSLDTEIVSVDDSFQPLSEEDYLDEGEIGSIFAEGSDMEDESEVSSLSGVTQSTPRQLTMDDIYAMNPNTTVIDIYTNEGYLSTLVGKYYDKKVTNVEEGVESIRGIASLLGLTKGCDFFAVYAETNNTGYTFYTYQQRYGGVVLRSATLRVVVDPDGYTAGLSCSFVPNLGTASKEPTISADDALKLVQKKFARFNLTYYPEHTVELAVPYQNAVYNCWVIYSNNPDATVSFDMPYIEHYVTTDGTYLTLIPANGFASNNYDVFDNTSYFRNMKVKEYSTTVKLADGTTRKLTVPVSYNSRDKLYYLMDPQRLIAVADYYDFDFRNTVTFVTSKTIDGWEQGHLLAYANYITLYDFYADHGVRSVDGFDTPILVTVGYCDENKQPVDNACFYGVNNGWACFAVSDINHYSDCVDVVGHEYTHGVTRQSMQGSLYRNETGAINEAYSDIMGNLAEMSLNYTADRDWLIGEKTGSVVRDMANPNDYQQPAYVGDRYYVSPVLNPVFGFNDYGGVHINNSLIGHIAYKMDQIGMSYEQQIAMWLTSIELITPRSDYQDLHGALLFALKVNGMLELYGPALNKAFKEAGLNEDWNESYLNATHPGCGRVTVRMGEDVAKLACKIGFYTNNGKLADYAYPDENGVFSVLLPADTYRARLVVLDDNGNNVYFKYTSSGWESSGNFQAFDLKAGAHLELGSPGSSSASDKLELIPFDGGYFSMLIPNGWRIEVNGQYTSFSVKIFDPNDPSTQLFYYAGLAPFHKSEAARRFWVSLDPTGVISKGPVLSSLDILGVLGTWSYDIEYQKYFEKQYFTDLYNIKPVGANYYNGYYSSWATGAIESAAFVHCATKFDDDCRLTITSALLNEDFTNAYGGYFPYSCHDLCGVLAPADRYDAVIGDLLTCLTSLKFTGKYIAESWTAGQPMADQATITGALTDLAGVMAAMYQMYRD